MTPNLYEFTAQYYDLGNGRGYVRDDLEFYLKVFKKQQSVLEIGCGTGRVGIELAQAGLRIAGLDLSKQMLNIFKSKLGPELSARISLHYGDMTSFDLHDSFDGRGVSP